MAKRLHEPNGGRPLLVLLTVVCTCTLAYLGISALFPTLEAPSSSLQEHVAPRSEDGSSESCCRGLEHTEFWGQAVNWGSNFLVDSARECCDACKKKLQCNSWVYCGNEERCGANYRQCWFKRQKDALAPEVHDSGSSNPWTSGLVVDKDLGTVGLALDGGSTSGVIHMKLLPECSPQSALRILELAKLIHCSGCRIYRAEGRGDMWDSNGAPIAKMGKGPPYALVQGTLEAQHVSFKKISREFAPGLIRRGMVGWVDGGPDFFISLADHPEWPRSKHTVFATVVEADMAALEALVALPTSTATWENVAVRLLDKPVDVKLQRVKKH